MAFSLHLDAAGPCINDRGYHEGYAYYIDNGEVGMEVLDREQAAGRQLLRLIDNAERAIRKVGDHRLSALAVVRFCEDHEPVRREYVGSVVMSHKGIVGSTGLAELKPQFDEVTGFGTYKHKGLGDGQLAVLPFQPEYPHPFNIVLADSPSGQNLYVAQQQGGVFEPEYVHLAPPK